MTKHRQVQAVFVFKYSTANYKATVGRFSAQEASAANDKAYSKDYLQGAPTDISKTCELFGLANRKDERMDLLLKWATGSQKGYLKRGGDRMRIGWGTNTTTPLPWAMAPAPSLETAQTIPGNPNPASISDANRQHDEVMARPYIAYLFAVKLFGEDSTLHLRTYIANPPEELAWSDIEKVPPSVQGAIRARIKGKKASTLVTYNEPLPEPDNIQEILSLLQNNPNVLLAGPPGTGKSHLMEQLATYVKDPGGQVLFDGDRKGDEFTELPSRQAGISRTVVFHPSYAYENLVAGLYPTVTTDGATVEARPGTLVNIATYAQNHPDSRCLLVLDEFNRGNAAAIFGDTLALLEKDKRGTHHIALPYDNITVKKPFVDNKDGEVISNDPGFTIPENLWIVAAMNTSDRSVAPIDAALRRRFSIFPLRPNYDLLYDHLATTSDKIPSPADNTDDLTASHIHALAIETLKKINERVTSVSGEDFCLGHANLWHLKGQSCEEAVKSTADAFDTRIIASLRMTYQDDDEALAVVLGIPPHDDQRKDAPKRVAKWRKPDKGLGSYGQKRLHITPLSTLDNSDIINELFRVCGIWKTKSADEESLDDPDGPQSELEDD